MKPKLAHVRSVALFRLDEIGDLVIASPLIRELRRNLPSAYITLAVNGAFRNLVEACPYVDRIVDVPLQKALGGWGEVTHLATIIGHVAREWWPMSYDLAILPRYGTDVQYARLLSWLSGIPWRVGFEEPTYRALTHRLGLSDTRLLNQRLSRAGDLHEVQRNLSVLQAIGGTIASDRLELWTTPADEVKARTVLHQEGGTIDIAICPAARYPQKRWPIERFIDTAERLLKVSPRVRIVLIGGVADESLAHQLREALADRSIDLTGKLTLRETGAVLRRCHLYIGCDTGPLHLAAAAGTPVIEISCHPVGGESMNNSSPVRFGPWSKRSIVLQPTANPPCVTHCAASEPHCILGISVDDVMSAAERSLTASPGTRGQGVQ